MAATIPTSVPAVFVKGDTVKFNITDSDYPASEGALGFFFVNADGSFTETTSTADGDTHNIVISATDSGLVTAGTFSYQGRYTHTATSEETTIREGTTTVKPEFTDTAYDNRSTVKTTLDALEATIQGKASGDQASMSIAGRSIARYSPEELLVWLDKYKRMYQDELAEEALAAGMANPRKVRIRFLN